MLSPVYVPYLRYTGLYLLWVLEGRIETDLCQSRKERPEFCAEPSRRLRPWGVVRESAEGQEEVVQVG